MDIATTAAIVFKIVTDGSRATLQPLYGALRGILVSDRAKALGFWAMERRQICWAHLLRKFVSFSERDGPSATFGRDLLNYTGILFEYWHDYTAGKLDRATFRAWMAPVSALAFARNRNHDVNVRAAFLHLASDAAVGGAVAIAGLLVPWSGRAWVRPAC